MSEMRYRTLGSSGLTVSVVGLGCNNFGLRCNLTAARRIVKAALGVGITLFDTADSYPPSGEVGLGESILGQVLKGNRDEVIIATKFGSDMQGANGPDWGARGSRRYILRAVETSLRRLQTEYIDLYQYHFPDEITPIEETLSALDKLVTEGKIRYIGSSNFSAWQVVEAEFVARRDHRTRFISTQNEYNLLQRRVEADLVPVCERYGIGILPYFPLANGLLTGKYRRGSEPPPSARLAGHTDVLSGEIYTKIEALERYAAARGLTLLEVAIGSLAAKPGVGSVIAGATSPKQVVANATAGSWQPTSADLAELDAVSA